MNRHRFLLCGNRTQRRKGRGYACYVISTSGLGATPSLHNFRDGILISSLLERLSLNLCYDCNREESHVTGDQSFLPDVWHTGPRRAAFLQQLWNRPLACRGSQPVRRAAAAELPSGTAGVPLHTITLWAATAAATKSPATSRHRGMAGPLAHHPPGTPDRGKWIDLLCSGLPTRPGTYTGYCHGPESDKHGTDPDQCHRCCPGTGTSQCHRYYPGT